MSFSTPIAAIYILDPSGIPLFARFYQGEPSKTDFTLLGGFFSAIEIFVKTNLEGLLTDIGLSSRRYFFNRSNAGYIIVIAILSNDIDQIGKSTLNIVNLLNQTILHCFSSIEEIVKHNLVEFEFVLENLGTAVDSFILESSFEFLGDDSLDDTMSKAIESISVGSEFLEEIRKIIESNR